MSAPVYPLPNVSHLGTLEITTPPCNHRYRYRTENAGRAGLHGEKHAPISEKRRAGGGHVIPGAVHRGELRELPEHLGILRSVRFPSL